MTISQRNALVEEHLWCIDSVIRQNWRLMAASHLSREDVYQSLAVRLVKAVGRYDPSKGRSLKEQPFPLQHVLPQRYVEEFEVSPKEFLAELNYLASAARQNVPLYLRGNEISLTVRGKKYSSVIDVNRRSSMLLGFNLREISDAIKQFEKEPLVKVRVGERNLPTMLEAEGRNDYALVLPVRIKEDAAA